MITLDVAGLTLRIRDSGGPGLPVLLTHGIGRLAGAVEPPVRDSRSGAAPDCLGSARARPVGQRPGRQRPGCHGPPGLAAAGMRWAWGGALLVGNSLGWALVSLRMAGQAPQRALGLLLAAAATLGRDTVLPFRLMTLPGLGTLMSRPGPMAVQQQIRAIVHRPQAITAEVREAIVRNVMRPGAADTVPGAAAPADRSGRPAGRGLRAISGAAARSAGAGGAGAWCAGQRAAGGAFTPGPGRGGGRRAAGAGGLRPHATAGAAGGVPAPAVDAGGTAEPGRVRQPSGWVKGLPRSAKDGSMRGRCVVGRGQLETLAGQAGFNSLVHTVRDMAIGTIRHNAYRRDIAGGAASPDPDPPSLDKPGNVRMNGQPNQISAVTGPIAAAGPAAAATGGVHSPRR